VAGTHKKRRHCQRQPKKSGEGIYNQQLCMPSGSFQQLSVQDYMDKDEIFERTCGTLKKKRKSTKNKKKVSAGEDSSKPMVMPLPRSEIIL